MSTNSSNSLGPSNSGQSRSSDEGASEERAPKNLENQAVESFEIDVTAGHSVVPADAELPSPAEPQPKAAAILPVEPSGSSAGQSTPSKPVESPAKVVTEKPAPVNAELPTQLDIQPGDYATPPPADTARRVARQSSWWITSLGVHILLLVSLAFSTLVVLQEEELELYASPAVYEAVEEFEDLEIDPMDDLESLEEELNAPDPDTLADLSSETLIEEPVISETSLSESTPVDETSSLAELGQLFVEDGTGMSGLDSEIGTGEGGAMAKFFGTEVKARRILYMLDNSGGMRKGGKFEALVSELQASIKRLNRKQKFYIIFYSDTVYPLFHPHSVFEFVKSTPKSQKMLKAWLDSVELCGGNAIDEALAATEEIRPDAVFLLTDGDLFTTEKKKAMLLNRGRRSYSIHTFGLGVGKQTNTADNLEQVAKANKGTFRAIKVTDEMKALAKEKQRPYHSKKRGQVWGLKVGKR